MTISPPQVYSLSHAELAWLEEQLVTVPGGWSLEVIRDPAELSAVLLPGDGDRFAATFLVDRVAGGYRLQACRWDAMELAGVFATLAECLGAVAAAASRATPFTRLQ